MSIIAAERFAIANDLDIDEVASLFRWATESEEEE